MNRIKSWNNPSLRWSLVSFLCGMLLMLQGCGVGESGDSSGYGLAGGGVGGTGYSSGAVSSFGSIYSNGIHFDTRHAEIIVEGQLVGKGDAAAHEHLNLGQIVRIEGDIYDNNTGLAMRVFYDKTMEGPVSLIESLDPYTRRITLLEQVIIADSQTVFVHADLHSLETDDNHVLEVSGYFNDDGSLYASFIEKKKASSIYTVTGEIAELNTHFQTFTVGGLDIDYRSVMMPMPVLVDGDKVRMKGKIDQSGILVAEEVASWKALDYRLEAEEIKIGGIVHRIFDDSDDDSDDDDDDDSDDDKEGDDTPREIVVAGVTVLVDEHTVFEGIQDAKDLTTGMEVVVYGGLEDGVVHSRRIEVKYNTVHTFGTVEDLDTKQHSFTVNGQLIRINSTTKIYSRDQRWEFSDIIQGDDIVLYGWIRTDSSVTAIKVFVVNEGTSPLILIPCLHPNQ